jgi:hypothetical protein
MFVVPPEPFRLDEPALFACCEPPMLHGEFCVAPVLRPELVPVPVPSVEPLPIPLLDAPAPDEPPEAPPLPPPPPPDCANAIPPLTARLSAVAAAKMVRLFMRTPFLNAASRQLGVQPRVSGGAKKIDGLQL